MSQIDSCTDTQKRYNKLWIVLIVVGIVINILSIIPILGWIFNVIGSICILGGIILFFLSCYFKTTFGVDPASEIAKATS